MHREGDTIGSYLLLRHKSFTPGDDLEVVEGVVLFNMWARRQPPFHVLASSDTVFGVDAATRTICWELRVADLFKGSYDSPVDVFRVLDERYGLSPIDCNAYIWEAPPDGWLLAFSCDVISRIDQAMPEGFDFGAHGGRNGWVDLAALDDATLTALALPNAGAPALRLAPRPAGEAGVAELRLPPGRYIPVHVRRIVLDRDGRTCRNCGATDLDDLHFDHVFPYAKGGPNTPDNLQVLCPACNLAKSDRIGPGVMRPADAWNAQDAAERRARLAELRGKAGGGDPDAAFELAPLVDDAEAAVLLQQVIDSSHPERCWAMIELADMRQADGETEAAQALLAEAHAGDHRKARGAAAVRLAETAQDPQERRRLLQEAIDLGDPDTAAEAAAHQYEEGATDSERRTLLELVMRHQDPEITALGAHHLADLIDDRQQRIELRYQALLTRDQELLEEVLVSLAVDLHNTGRTDIATTLLDRAARNAGPELADEVADLARQIRR